MVCEPVRREVSAVAQRGRKPKPERKAPRCPGWLEAEAKKEWKRMAKQMELLGILTEIDMAAFAGYCQAYARDRKSTRLNSSH